MLLYTLARILLAFTLISLLGTTGCLNRGPTPAARQTALNYANKLGRTEANTLAIYDFCHSGGCWANVTFVTQATHDDFETLAFTKGFGRSGYGTSGEYLLQDLESYTHKKPVKIGPNPTVGQKDWTVVSYWTRSNPDVSVKLYDATLWPDFYEYDGKLMKDRVVVVLAQ